MAVAIEEYNKYSLSQQRDVARTSRRWTHTGQLAGMPAFVSNEIGLVPHKEIDTGENSDENTLNDEVSGGFSDNGLMGNAAKVRPGERVIRYTVMEGGKPIGTLVAGVIDKKITSIHNIVIEDQGKGSGEIVVAALAANSSVIACLG